MNGTDTGGTGIGATRANNTAQSVSFGERLRAAMSELGPLCVGIDPHPHILEAWGLPDDARGLRTFALTATQAFDGAAAAIKPQSALFERHGAAGVAVLEEVIGLIRASGTATQVILDAKRGDIGSTMLAYAQAYLDNSSPMCADALTVSPYLGYESLRPAIEVATANGNGLFVLALTSNPEGASLQHRGKGEGEAVAASIVRQAAQDNALPEGQWGSVGLVVGATIGPAAAELGIDFSTVNGPFLAPGIGAQGGTAKELKQVFGAGLAYVLPAVSREVLQTGPNIEDLREKTLQTAREMRASLAG